MAAYVIVGASMAGATAAITLREESRDTITVYFAVTFDSSTGRTP